MVRARRRLAPKTPAKTDIFAPIATFQRTAAAATPDIDENRSLLYKPRQLSAMSRFHPGAARLGRKWPFFGPARITGRISIQQAELPGQRRTTREADLSTQQTGAQAPSRLPRPSRHRRRPQGSRRPPCAWPQASERLSRIFRRFHSWIGGGSGRTFSPLPMPRARTALPWWCRAVPATLQAPPREGDPYTKG